MYYFFKNLLYSQKKIRQSRYMIMMIKEGSINYMTPWTGIVVLGCGHISHIVKMHYILKNLLLYIQA